MEILFYRPNSGPQVVHFAHHIGLKLHSTSTWDISLAAVEEWLEKVDWNKLSSSIKANEWHKHSSAFGDVSIAQNRRDIGSFLAKALLLDFAYKFETAKLVAPLANRLEFNYVVTHELDKLLTIQPTDPIPLGADVLKRIASETSGLAKRQQLQVFPGIQTCSVAVTELLQKEHAFPVRLGFARIVPLDLMFVRVRNMYWLHRAVNKNIPGDKYIGEYKKMITKMLKAQKLSTTISAANPGTGRARSTVLKVYNSIVGPRESVIRGLLVLENEEHLLETVSVVQEPFPAEILPELPTPGVPEQPVDPLAEVGAPRIKRFVIPNTWAELMTALNDTVMRVVYNAALGDNRQHSLMVLQYMRILCANYTAKILSQKLKISLTIDLKGFLETNAPLTFFDSRQLFVLNLIQTHQNSLVIGPTLISGIANSVNKIAVALPNRSKAIKIEQPGGEVIVWISKSSFPDDLRSHIYHNKFSDKMCMAASLFLARFDEHTDFFWEAFLLALYSRLKTKFYVLDTNPEEPKQWIETHVLPVSMAVSVIAYSVFEHEREETRLIFQLVANPVALHLHRLFGQQSETYVGHARTDTWYRHRDLEKGLKNLAELVFEDPLDGHKLHNTLSSVSDMGFKQTPQQ